MLNLTEQLNTAQISSLTREGQPSKEQKHELNQSKHYLVLGLPRVEQGVVAEAKKRERVWESKDSGTHCVLGKHLTLSNSEKSEVTRQISSAFFLLLLNSLI